jgi:tetratricopeptide (TPR) repeat protein
MNIEELVTKTEQLNRDGEELESLKLYSKAFDMLADEASIHAHKQPETIKDEETSKGEKTRKILPKLFEETKKYFKRDTAAYVIQKNMAVMFYELGDKESAIHSLNQAIELAPDGHDVSEALNGLENLKKII